MSSQNVEVMKAYILINTELGMTNDVLAKLKKIPGIITVAVITGEFDIIARVETVDMNEMYNRTQEVHLIDGIVETTTSIIQKEF
ncbi:MAG: Lrp/AsnC ligand binding domain-containing protein [Candidatus Heimdallarchaeota archaeon]